MTKIALAKFRVLFQSFHKDPARHLSSVALSAHHRATGTSEIADFVMTYSIGVEMQLKDLCKQKLEAGIFIYIKVYNEEKLTQI